MEFNAETYEQKDDFAKLPEGVYRVSCSANSKNKVSNDGKDQLVLELDVISSADGDIAHCGRKVWYTVTAGEHANSFLGQALVGFGVPFPANKQCPPSLFIGRRAKIEVKHNGEYVNVKKFLKADAQTEGLTAEPQEDTESDIPF